MKKFSKILFCSFAVVSCFGSSSFAVNPTSVYLKIYAILASTNTDCSDPVVVMSSSTPVEVDMLTAPELGGGSMDDGTYPCVIMKMSDIIRFTPESTTGVCTGGTEYTIDVCRADNSGTYTPVTISGSTATYGSETACAGTSGSNSEDIVSLFLSTASTATGGGEGNAFARPTVATNGFNLSSAFVVSGTGSGEFIVNFNDKIDGSSSECDVQPPVFGFR